MAAEDVAAERVGFRAVENFRQGLRGDIAQCVLMILVVAAGEYIAIRGDYAARPEAEARP
jgi:hypothetical protein